MSHNLQRLGKLLIKPPTWDRPTPAALPNADKSGETHPQGASCFSSHAPGRTTGINTASQSQTNHVKTHSCFWLLAKLAELCPCRPVYPQGKTREIFERK